MFLLNLLLFQFLCVLFMCIQVWVKSSSNISPFVLKKASGTKAGVTFVLLLITGCGMLIAILLFRLCLTALLSLLATEVHPQSQQNHCSRHLQSYFT